MLTIIEAPLFSRQWPDYWSIEEHGAFMSYLANDPDAGTVIPGSGDAARYAGAWTAKANEERSG